MSNVQVFVVCGVSIIALLLIAGLVSSGITSYHERNLADNRYYRAHQSYVLYLKALTAGYSPIPPPNDIHHGTPIKVNGVSDTEVR